MKVRIVYHRPQDLVADHDQQMQRGGLLLLVDGTDVERGAEVALRIESPEGRVDVGARVLQPMGASGVAVAFDASADLQALVAAARAAGSGDGPTPEHSLRDDDDASPGRAVDVHTRVKNASPTEKLQMALHGGRDERALLLREPSPALHKYLLRNPHIGTGEVAQIARMRTTTVEVLGFIAARREWQGRPEIASALVRNPKTPVPLALRMVDNLAATEVRQLARTASLRAPILRAVRKRALG